MQTLRKSSIPPKSAIDIIFFDKVRKEPNLQEYREKFEKIQLLWPHGQKQQNGRGQKKSNITPFDF